MNTQFTKEIVFFADQDALDCEHDLYGSIVSAMDFKFELMLMTAESLRDGKVNPTKDQIVWLDEADMSLLD